MLDQLAGQGMLHCVTVSPLAAAPHAAYKYAQGTGLYRCGPHYICTSDRQTRERPAGCKVPALSLQHLQGRCSLFTLFHSFLMFTATAIRTSDACRFISVDLLTGTAIVDFKDGNQYKYTNVSRRAIINLMMQPQMSLGFWANKNCVQADRPSYAVVADYATA